MTLERAPFSRCAYSPIRKRRKLSDDARKRKLHLEVRGLQEADEMASHHGVTIAIAPFNCFDTDLVTTCEPVPDRLPSPVPIRIRSIRCFTNPLSLKLLGLHYSRSCSYCTTLEQDHLIIRPG